MNPDVPPLPLDTLLAHVDGMRRLARRLVHDPALAEDVAQDAVLVALSKGPRHRRNLRGWLNGIVRNVARDSRRSDARRARHESEAPPPAQPPDPLSRTVQLTEQKRLLEAVERLAEPYRDAIWRRYFENQQPRAISRELGVSIETVNTRLKRARATLRARLDREHAGDRRAWAIALTPLAASGSSWALPTWIGGALVTTKTKLGVLAALVLLAAASALWLAGSEADDPDTGSNRVARIEDPEAGTPSEAVVLEGREGAGPEAWTDEAGDARRLRGLCVDEAGRPLGGVEIRAGPPDEVAFEALRVVARSHEDGSFAFALAIGADARRVVAHAAGRIDAVAHVPEIRAEPLRLRLPAAPRYAYRLLDGRTDQPLAGVRCEVRRAFGHRHYTRATTSDERGVLVLTSPSADELDRFVAVRIVHEGYRPLLQLPRPDVARGTATSARPRDVYLFPAPHLVVDVRDEAGRPVEGALVEAWAGDPGASTVAPEWRPATIRGWQDAAGNGVVLGKAVSDAEGRSRLRAGPKHLGWWAYARCGDAAGLVHGGSPYGDQDVQRTLTLHPTVRLEGTVTGTDGEPLSRVRVEYTPAPLALAMLSGGVQLPPDALARRFRTMTDEGGDYELEGVPVPAQGGKVHVVAHRGDLGFASESVETPSGRSGRIRIDFVLERRQEVQAVRVVDEEGVSIAGALVTYSNVLPGMLTGEDGRTEILRHPAAQGPAYKAFKRGYVIGAAEHEDDVAEIRIVLHRGASLEGRVVDPQGAPHGAYVDVYDAHVAELPKKQRTQQYLTAHWFGRAQAGPDGRFRLEDLPPGPYFVRFWYTTRRAGSYHVVLGERPAQEGDALELVLPETEPEPDPVGVVEGSVYDEEGNPVTEYWMTLQGPGATRTPDLLGRRFRYETAAPGTWRLSASAAQGTRKSEMTVVVRANETTSVRVVLAPALAVRGRLVDESGKGIGGTYVQLIREGARSAVGFRGTDAEGRFEMENLLPARYRARVRSRADEKPYVVSDELFELIAGGTEELVLRAKPAGTLTLELDDERFLAFSRAWQKQSGTPRGRRSWYSRVEVTSAAGEVLTDVGLFLGRKTFAYPLGAGNYDLVVKTMNEGTFRTSFAIKTGGDTVVPVVLEE